MKKWLRADLWVDLERTYKGAELEENWDALYKMITLMHKVAQEVGDRLGYVYPDDLERRTLAYLRKVKSVIHQNLI